MSSSNTLLHGHKVLIIGGSSGIGLAVAAAALASGASTVIASSTQDKVNTAVELLKKGIEGNTDVTALGEVVDIKNFPVLSGFLTKHAPFDHLVITAGEAPSGSPKQSSGVTDLRDTLKDTMDSRYWAALNAANIINKNNLIRPGGSITLTSGTVTQRPFPGFGYAIGAAGAIETATRGLAVDLGPLRINTICLGFIDTPLVRGWPEVVRRSIMDPKVEKLPVGHIGQPEEAAEAYLFAMKCKYLTGQVITVDGGGVLV